MGIHPFGERKLGKEKFPADAQEFFPVGIPSGNGIFHRRVLFQKQIFSPIPFYNLNNLLF